ncbi:T9SS type A sorting domain-containing protein, partial [Bacteroidota bacterium]
QVINENYNLKGDGAAFWSEDFDWENPDDIKGWSLPDGWALIDNTGTDSTGSYGFNWYWTMPDSVVSSWTSEPAFRSTTAHNGYMLLCPDMYNTEMGLFEVGELLNVDNALEFAPIDCSAHETVIFRMEYNFMNYSSGYNEIQVSVDDWVHIAVYDCRHGAGHKDRVLDAKPGQAVIFEGNISDVAAGNENVRIRVRWYGTSLYYWYFDDVSLSEAYDNDLQIGRNKTFGFDLIADDDDIESALYMIPKTQLGGGGFTNFDAGVINFGELDQTGVMLDVEITKGGVSVFNAQSEPVDMIAQGDPDTLNVAEKYTPEEFGHYAVKMNIISNAVDNNPGDNGFERLFHVTDSVYSRSDDTSEFDWATGKEQYDTGPTEGWFDFTILPIRGACEANSASVFITGGSDVIEFRYVIIDPNVEEGEFPYELLVSDFMSLDPSLYGTWVTMPFEKDGESEFLIAGNTYYVGIQYWYDGAERMDRRNTNLQLGTDRSVTWLDANSGYCLDYENYYSQTSLNRMIRLNINNHDNINDGIPTAGNLNSLDQNYPNPFNSTTEISYKLAAGTEVNIEVNDISGRKVMELNEGYKPAGNHKAILNAENLEAGVYYYTLSTNNTTQTKKMVISR